MRQRIPESDCWQDHATECPNCKQLVMQREEHFKTANLTDPSWWDCDWKNAADD